MAASKIAEGDRLVAEAKQSLKTSFLSLKFSPDYDNAAHSYGKAGLAYRNGKAYDKAKEAYLNAAETHLKKNSVYHSAKALEDAGAVCKEMKKFDEAARLWEQASERFCMADAESTSTIVLENAAKLVETSNPARSAELYTKLSKIYKDEGRRNEWGKALRGAGNMYISATKFDEALSTYSEYRVVVQAQGAEISIHNAIMIQILILLRLGKAKDAKKTLKTAYNVPSFEGTKEAALLESLMEALTTQDTQELAKLCSDHLIKTLDTAVVKMARDLPSTVMDTTNLLDEDDDQQLLDDGDDDDDLNLEGEGDSQFPMRVKPRTDADNLRDELFGISRAAPPKKEAVSSVPPPRHESSGDQNPSSDNTQDNVGEGVSCPTELESEAQTEEVEDDVQPPPSSGEVTESKPEETTCDDDEKDNFDIN